MESGQTKSVAITIREWAQFLLLLFAAAWGAYTFIWKEIWVPRSAPINITMGLDVKESGIVESGVGKNSGSLIAVEMKVSARNPSARTVYLLKSVWVAYGNKLAAEIGDDNGAFLKNVNDTLNAPSGLLQVDRYAAVDSSSIAAAGELLSDELLKPQEVVSRTILFYVPRGKYDLLIVQALVPSSGVAGAAEVDWNVDDRESLVPACFRIDDNKRTEMQKDKNGDCVGDPRLELQMSASDTAISLSH